MSKIMVVDDDEDFTALYKQSLEMAGYVAIVENTSSKAMELAYSELPDLFILDLMMPEPDGFQLCRMIRADSKLRHIPIIIITALTDMDSKLVAIGAGANDYLTKPFHIKDLRSRITTLLDRVK
jgi:DNA-binding response OmpR family regulator